MVAFGAPSRARIEGSDLNKIATTVSSAYPEKANKNLPLKTIFFNRLSDMLESPK